MLDNRCHSMIEWTHFPDLSNTNTVKLAWQNFSYVHIVSDGLQLWEEKNVLIVLIAEWNSSIEVKYDLDLNH